MNTISKDIVKLVVNCLEDKKAENIQVIDISEISILGDYFIIANGSNKSQIQAISDHIEETLGRQGINHKSIEGYNKANWILLDYRDVVIHVFDPESRDFYDLERIWRDGTLVDLNEIK